MKEHSYFKKTVWGISCSIFLIVLDQLSKNAAVRYLRGQEPLILIDDVFELRYLENRGAAFGILQDKQMFFVCITLLSLLLIAYIYLKKIPDERRFVWLNVVAVLFFSGAIGNLIDRLTQNYVVDFFYFRLIDFPIFNVADIYVSVGAALMIVLMLFCYREADFDRIFSSQSSGDV